MSKAYTLEELLVITVAKEIHDYENVVLGMGLPIAAGALAKAIYSPHTTLIMESGIIDLPMLQICFPRLPWLTGDLWMSASLGWPRLTSMGISIQP